MPHSGEGGRVYGILPWAPTPEQWADVVEDPATARKSLDETQVVLKWYEGVDPLNAMGHSYMHTDPPPSMDGVTRYSHTEAITIMQTPEWTPPEP